MIAGCRRHEDTGHVARVDNGHMADVRNGVGGHSTLD